MITPDGLLFLQSFAVAAAIYVAWIVWQLATNNGMARVHKIFLLGNHGICFAPWLILVWLDCEKTIPAHERVHAKQQLALGRWFGFLKFHWLYLTDRKQRQAWEVEAYQESYNQNPAGLNNYALYLRQYGVNMTQTEALRLLTVGQSS
jgi:hypothetical protein